MLEQTIEQLQSQNTLLKVEFAQAARLPGTGNNSKYSLASAAPSMDAVPRLRESSRAMDSNGAAGATNGVACTADRASDTPADRECWLTVRPESSVGRWWDERVESPCSDPPDVEDEQSDDELRDEELSDDETNEQVSTIDAQTKGDMLATISKVFGDGPQRSTSPDTQVHEELGMKQSPHDKLDVVFDWHSPRVSDASETQVTSPTSAWLGQVRRACTCTRTQASPHATAQHGTALHGMEWCSVAHGLHAHMHARTHARTHACMHARMHSGL